MNLKAGSGDREHTETSSVYPPSEEPGRQNYFIEKCREHVSALAVSRGRSLTFHITTLGCQMNAKDSEKLKGILLQIGYRWTDSEDADFVLYNTCTVRENANLKVYGHLGYLQSLKKKQPDKIIALCGCMMQEADVPEKIRKNYRLVDIVFGTYNIYKLAEILWERFFTGKPVVEIWDDAGQIVEELPSYREFPFKSGVNITYGCDNFCSYCIVPYVRGRERSRKPEHILAEVQKLADEGVVEIMLLGQNVNSYGKNLPTPVTFADLLRRVERVDGIRRIRFMTPHPKDFSEEVLAVMRDSEKICHQIHLPLQSGSTRILKKMNRRYTKEQYLALVDTIREYLPDASISTDIIVGFPGETEEDFEETLDVVRQVRYDAAYTFLYSKRSGTPAAKMEQVPEAVAGERFGRLLDTIHENQADAIRKNLGRTLDVLVEKENDVHGYLTGRLENNTLVHFPGDTGLIGKIVPVKLTQEKGFYYFGETVS
ncbi:MAG: tRNA (N6-isopentenyl adenosine(37)-C2)-methylthiotransferase MiaB [Lachnospiraceae bacterium]|nr:tRNA (N6-isopentenyl adenosine(37)-C2)-methylthiotransferase MiaB [Lachnospiraceae bacterium]